MYDAIDFLCNWSDLNKILLLQTLGSRSDLKRFIHFVLSIFYSNEII